MKLKHTEDISAFIAVIDSCQGAVWLESPDGDKINLKSELSKYIGIAELVKLGRDRYDLYCACREDQERFFALFNSHPEIMN